MYHINLLKHSVKKKAGFFVFNYGWKLLDKQICK